MSKVIAEYNDLKLIADAIRNRTGETADLSLEQMPSAIVGIKSPDPVLQTKTVTPTTNVQNVTPDSGYDGLGKVTVNAIPSTYVEPSATKSATTYTPTTLNQTIAAGTYCSGVQTIEGDSNLKVENIAEGMSIFGITGTHSGGTDTSDATASADEIFSGETAYVDGNKVTGTFTIENELDTQDDLISQTQTALQGKSAGGGTNVKTCTVTITTPKTLDNIIYTELLQDGTFNAVNLTYGFDERPSNITLHNVVCGTSLSFVNIGYTLPGYTSSNATLLDYSVYGTNYGLSSFSIDSINGEMATINVYNNN